MPILSRVEVRDKSGQKKELLLEAWRRSTFDEQLLAKKQPTGDTQFLATYPVLANALGATIPVPSEH